MYRGAFPTPRGDIWLWGERTTLEPEAPLILVIAGAFCRPDALWFRLQPLIPETTVLAAQLPGHRSPALNETTFPALVEAFSYVLQNSLGGRPILVCGESIGGSIALALPNLGVGRVALDPPLRTGQLWPLKDFFAQSFADFPSRRPLLQNVFGFDGANFEEIDYLPFVRHWARVLLGDIPLQPPRPFEVPPSLVGEAERQLLLANPVIHTSVVEGAGHVLVWYEKLLVEVLREEVGKAVRRWSYRAPTWSVDTSME